MLPYERNDCRRLKKERAGEEELRFHSRQPVADQKQGSNPSQRPPEYRVPFPQRPPPIDGTLSASSKMACMLSPHPPSRVATVAPILDVTSEPHQHRPDGFHVFPPQMGKTEVQRCVLIPSFRSRPGQRQARSGLAFVVEKAGCAPEVPALFYKSLMWLGCSTQPGG